jgi:hypothetical protein
MFRKLISSTLAVILAVIVLGGFASPASAWTEAEFRPLTSSGNLAYVSPDELSDEFTKGVFGGFGGIIGGILACYAVDVLVAPINPPLGVYLATVCPGLGGIIGGTSGYKGTELVIEAF